MIEIVDLESCVIWEKKSVELCLVKRKISNEIKIVT